MSTLLVYGLLFGAGYVVCKGQAGAWLTKIAAWIKAKTA